MHDVLQGIRRMSTESNLQVVLSKWRKFLMGGGSLSLGTFGELQKELMEAVAPPKKEAPAPKPKKVEVVERAEKKAERPEEAPPIKKRRPSKPKSE